MGTQNVVTCLIMVELGDTPTLLTLSTQKATLIRSQYSTQLQELVRSGVVGAGGL